jgi:hypothetical protein
MSSPGIPVQANKTFFQPPLRQSKMQKFYFSFYHQIICARNTKKFLLMQNKTLRGTKGKICFNKSDSPGPNLGLLFW